MDIFKLRPAVVSTIWGGRKLIEDYGIESDAENCAEAWMLSCFDGHESVCSSGEFKGKTIKEIASLIGNDFLGTKAKNYNDFPLLIKFIDAADDLSVQVHPGDDYAKKYNGGFGKTECWYIMDCEPGAKIIYGFNDKYSTDDFARAIEEGKIEEMVNYVEVKKGDFFLIEAGTLHAICKGILLAEVQQNSNITFRAYDYNRYDERCKGPRPLHIKETLDVTKCEKPQPSIPICTSVKETEGCRVTDLLSFSLFTVKKAEINGSYTGEASEKSFAHLLIMDGSGTVSCNGVDLEVRKGEGVFVPAGSGAYVVKGSLTVLESTL